MIRVRYYGWFDRRWNEWRLSRLPPDAPVRPSLPFPTKADLQEFLSRKRATVLWYPPLTLEQERSGGREAMGL